MSTRAATLRGFARNATAGIFSRLGDQWNPRMLGNLAFWHPTDLVASTTSNDLRIDASNRVSLHADKSGNSDVNCLVLNGAASNNATVANGVTPSINITGDIDIRWRGSLADWTPAARAVLVSKYNSTGNQRGYWLAVTTGGNLELNQSTDGTAVTTFTSSAATGITDGAIKWVRVLLDVDNGAAGRTATFWLSDDGATWTQLGTAQTAATAANTVDVTAALIIGGNDAGAFNVPTGNVYAVQIFASLDGTDKRLDIDFNTPTKLLADGNTFVCTTGQTVTLKTTGAYGARIAGARDLVNLVAASQPIYLSWDGTHYAWFMGVAGFTVSVPLANDTYDVLITYLDGTTDTSTVVVGAGVAAFGGTDVKFATKKVRLITVSKSSVQVAKFDAQFYVSGATFVSGDALTWTLNGGAHIVTRTCIYGNGSTHYLKSALYPLAQPVSVSAVVTPVSFTNGDTLIEGNASGIMRWYQNTATPDYTIRAADVGPSHTMPLGVAAVAGLVWNGATSTARTNRGTRTTATVSTGVPGGLTVFARTDGTSNANATYSDIFGRSVANDVATENRIALYESRKWRIPNV